MCIRDSPRTVPDASTTTAPMGTSPVALAPMASSSAWPIHAAYGGGAGGLLTR